MNDFILGVSSNSSRFIHILSEPTCENETVGRSLACLFIANYTNELFFVLHVFIYVELQQGTVLC